MMQNCKKCDKKEKQTKFCHNKKKTPGHDKS